MSKKLKFKVGDQVRITGDRHVGEIGVISRVKGDKLDSRCYLATYDYEVKFDEELEYTHRGNRDTGPSVYRYYNEYNLELVSTTTKYKPGDMVTVRDDLDRWIIYHMADKSNPMAMTDQMLGKRGKVVKIKSVTKTGKYMIEGSIFPWVDEMFEDKPKTKAKPKTDTNKSYRFEVGDKVKHRHYPEYGIGTVVKVNSSVCDYDVTWSGLTKGHDGDAKDGSTNHWYVDERNIEKREPKVGDRIRMTTHYCSAMPGMVGTIIGVRHGVVNVKFDNKFDGGHSCCGMCEYGFGHNVYPRHFEFIDEAKSHLICSVKFAENGKLYCYLTDDTTITVGSEVKVPVGKTDREKTATVERIGYYTEADAPYKVSEMKKVIGKAITTFDWEAFEKTKIIVKLDTKEKYDAFMKECDEHGIKWRGGRKATEGDRWSIYGKRFSVTCNFDRMPDMGYANIEFHTEELPDAVVYDYKLPESKVEVKPEPKPKYYEGKVVCVETKPHFAYTVGKVYTVTDGKIKIDNGNKLPYRNVASVDELNKELDGIAKFVEFKG